MKLSDAVDEYLTYRRSTGMKPNTVRIDSQALNHLLVLVGNIQMKSLGPQHGERYLAAMLSRGFKPNTVNTHVTALSGFFRWARLRKYLPPLAEPLSTVRALRNDPSPRHRLSRDEIFRLLEGSPHPQERIILALGLFLFLRGSEITHLTISDLNLDQGEMRVFQPKTGRTDPGMPICSELDAELRRWLTWYSADAAPEFGSLMPGWYLVPARRRQTFVNDGGRGKGHPVAREFGVVDPRRQLQRPHRYVQQGLTRIGWEVEGEREGVHTLRRSGARLLFDEMVDSGEVRDGVLRHVSSMLHHKSVTTTEIYLGLEVDREKRNTLLKGRPMFRQNDENVIPIHREA